MLKKTLIIMSLGLSYNNVANANISYVTINSNTTTSGLGSNTLYSILFEDSSTLTVDSNNLTLQAVNISNNSSPTILLQKAVTMGSIINSNYFNDSGLAIEFGNPTPTDASLTLLYSGNNHGFEAVAGDYTGLRLIDLTNATNENKLIKWNGFQGKNFNANNLTIKGSDFLVNGDGHDGNNNANSSMHIEGGRGFGFGGKGGQGYRPNSNPTTLIDAVNGGNMHINELSFEETGNVTLLSGNGGTAFWSGGGGAGFSGGGGRGADFHGVLSAKSYGGNGGYIKIGKLTALAGMNNLTKGDGGGGGDAGGGGSGFSGGGGGDTSATLESDNTGESISYGGHGGYLQISNFITSDIKSITSGEGGHGKWGGGGGSGFSGGGGGNISYRNANLNSRFTLDSSGGHGGCLQISNFTAMRLDNITEGTGGEGRGFSGGGGGGSGFSGGGGGGFNYDNYYFSSGDVNSSGGNGGAFIADRINISTFGNITLGSGGDGGNSAMKKGEFSGGNGGSGFAGGGGGGRKGGNGGLVFIQNLSLGSGSKESLTTNIIAENGGSGFAGGGGGGGSIEIGTLALLSSQDVTINIKHGAAGSLGIAPALSYNKDPAIDTSGSSYQFIGGGAGGNAQGAGQGGHAYIGNLIFDRLGDGPANTVSFTSPFTLMGYEYKTDTSTGEMLTKDLTAPNGTIIKVPEIINNFSGSGGRIKINKSTNLDMPVLDGGLIAKSATIDLGYKDVDSIYPASISINKGVLTLSDEVIINTYFSPNETSATFVNKDVNTNIALNRGDMVITGDFNVDEATGNVTDGIDGTVIGGGSIRLDNSKLDLSNVSKMNIIVHDNITILPKVDTLYRYYLVTTNNGGEVVTPVDPSSIEYNLVEGNSLDNNAFIKWRYYPDTYLLQAIVDVEEVVQTPISKELVTSYKEGNNVAAQILGEIGATQDPTLAINQLSLEKSGLAVEANDTAHQQVLERVSNMIVESNENGGIDGAGGVGAGEETDDTNRRKGLWTQYSFYKAKQSGNNAYNVLNHTPSIGYDGSVTENYAMGIAYSRSDTKIKDKVRRGGVKTSKINMFNIYGLYNFPNADNLFVSYVAGYGFGKVKNTQLKLIGREVYVQANSSYKTQIYTAKGAIHYRYAIDKQQNTVIAPGIGLRYSYFKDAGYQESGAGIQNFRVGSSKSLNLDLIPGIVAKHSYFNAQSGLIISPNIFARAYVNLKSKNDPTLIYSDGFNTPVKVQGEKASKAWYEVGGGVDLNKELWSLDLKYSISIDKKYLGQQGSIKLRLNL